MQKETPSAFTPKPSAAYGTYQAPAKSAPATASPAVPPPPKLPLASEVGLNPSNPPATGFNAGPAKPVTVQTPITNGGGFNAGVVAQPTPAGPTNEGAAARTPAGR